MKHLGWILAALMLQTGCADRKHAHPKCRKLIENQASRITSKILKLQGEMIEWHQATRAEFLAWLHVAADADRKQFWRLERHKKRIQELAEDIERKLVPPQKMICLRDCDGCPHEEEDENFAGGQPPHNWVNPANDIEIWRDDLMRNELPEKP